MKQCFKVYWTSIDSDFEPKIDSVEKYINEPIAKMIEKGRTVVNTQSSLSNQSEADSPYVMVSVLFQKN